jgi:autotransporter passenger strand-loop-strand repeat protein
MTTTIVSSGITTTGTVLNSGDVLKAFSGGVASFTMISSGGSAYVSAGGSTLGTIVSNGGAEFVSSGGSAYSTVVSNGGFEIVSSGGSAVGTTVSNGGFEIVSSGGVASNATLDSGGTLVVESGGTASGVAVNSGGNQYVELGGTAAGTTVNGGGTELLFGGVASNATVGSGGSEIISSGGSAVGDTLDNGGSAVVSNGGSAIGTIVSNGGSAIVSSGGTAVGTTVNGGGTELVFANGVASLTTLNSGGTEILSGGSAVSTTVASGGSEIVSFGGVASFTTVSSGGFEILSSGGIASGTAVDSGGFLLVLPGGSATSPTGAGGVVTTGVLLVQPDVGITAYPSLADGIVVSAGASEFILPGGTASNGIVSSGGTEAIYAGGSAVSTTVANGGSEQIFVSGTASGTTLNLGGMIDVASLAYTSGGSASVNSSTDFLTVSVGGQSYTQTLVGNYTGETFVLANDGSGGTLVTAACYRAGTLIRTDRGEVPIEQLRAGDRVASVFGGMVEVVWLGHRRVDCRRHPRPQDVWPVRVAAGAFGADLPRRDLLLSPDHAVYVDGVLIPIRHLVNDATITQEAVDEVTYWHVELPAHDVMFAEGLPAESYLDTGNRGAFANGDGPVMLNPDFALRVWEAESCAALVVEGAVLAAVRRHLLARAEALGHATTRDAVLRLVAGGRIFRPVVEGRLHRFRLPPGTNDIRLLSRSAVPAALHADSDDHRRLGVAVARISLDGEAIALSDARLGGGWHDVEIDAGDGQGPALCWTDGDAALEVAGGGVLEVDVAMTARYWLTAEPEAARRQRRTA